MNNVVPISADEPRIAVIAVTPDMAERWLGKNLNNRNIRKPVYAGYARDMRAGRWQLNGETIKFAEDGTLLDGQHRLHAVIAAGVSVPMLVVRGIPMKAMPTVDTGAGRKFSDVLKIEGDSNTSTLAALVRRAWMWDQGARTNTGASKPTRSEMMEYLEANPEIRHSAEIARQLQSRSLLPASVVGLSHWLFSAIDPDAATWFVSRVVDEDVPTDHPARVLHRRIVGMRLSGGRVNETEALALTIRAWNAFRSGRSAQKFQMPKGGLTNSNFPEPR